MKTRFWFLTFLLAGLSAQAQVTNRFVTRPASLGLGANSVANLVKYPEAEARGKAETEVAFFCDVDREGKAANFLPYRPAESNNVFVVAVRNALTAAKFEPAISQGELVNVQLGASVIFKIESGWPTPLVRLNLSDKSPEDRNYTGPQLIGGSLGLLHNVAYPDIARAQRLNGVVDLAFEIDTRGIPRDVRIISENPTGHGFGESAVAALKKVRYIPAQFRDQWLAAPSRQRIEYNIEVIERYAPTRPAKKKS